MKRIFSILLLSILVFLAVKYQEDVLNALDQIGSIDAEPLSEEEKKNLKICTWNIQDLGKSKDDEELKYMAKIIHKNKIDLIAIQEIVVSFYGSKNIAKIADELNRKGSKWDYIISNPTKGHGKEKYAFLWKTSKLKLVKNLGLMYSKEKAFDREPFLAKFEIKAWKQKIFCVNFHALPRSKNPENEILRLDEIHAAFPSENIVFLADFNLSEKHEAFDELRALAYQSVIQNQKTSIKKKTKKGKHLANELDNIFFEKKAFKLQKAGIIDFTKDFSSLEKARKISDHLPVWATFVQK